MVDEKEILEEIDRHIDAIVDLICRIRDKDKRLATAASVLNSIVVATADDSFTALGLYEQAKLLHFIRLVRVARIFFPVEYS